MRKLKELIDAGELGEVLCVYGNRQNLGIVRTNENALWSLGVHDLSVILYLLDEEPEEAVAHGRDFLTEGVEDVVFCYLRFPSGKIAHMHLSWLDPHKMRKITVVGREKMVVFDDMELERKVTVYEKGPWKRAESYGEWQTRSGDIYIPKIPTDEPLKLECQEFLRLIAGKGDRRKVAEDGARVVRALDRLTESLAWLRFIRPRPSIRARCSARTCGCSRTPSSASSRRSARSRRRSASRCRRRRSATARSSRPARSSSPGSTDRRRVHPRRPVVRPRARRRSQTTSSSAAARSSRTTRRSAAARASRPRRTSPPTRRSRRTSSSRRAS